MIGKRFRVAMSGHLLLADRETPHLSVRDQPSWFMVSRLGPSGEVLQVSHCPAPLGRGTQAPDTLEPGDTLVGALSVSVTTPGRRYFQLLASLSPADRCPGRFMPAAGVVCLFREQGRLAIEGWGQHCAGSENRLTSSLPATSGTGEPVISSAWSLEARYRTWRREILLD